MSQAFAVAMQMIMEGKKPTMEEVWARAEKDNATRWAKNIDTEEEFLIKLGNFIVARQQAVMLARQIAQQDASHDTD